MVGGKAAHGASQVCRSIFPGRAGGSIAVPSGNLLLFILATICILIITLVTFTEWNDRQRRLSGASHQAATLARVLEEQMASLFHGADQTLLGIAEGLRNRPEMGAHDPDFENSLRRRLKNLPAVRALFVIGTDGYIVQDSDRDTPRRNLADRQYFLAHQNGTVPEFFVDEPLISRSTGNWFVALSRGSESPDGEFAGVVVAAVDITYFENFYADLGLGADDVIALVTTDGVLMARQPPAGDKVGQRLGPADGMSALQEALGRKPSGIFETQSSVDGIRRLFGYRAMPDHPLVVLVGLSKDGVLAPWHQGATVAGLATASGVGISILLWWLALHYARREAAAQAASAQGAKLEAIGRTTSGVAHDFNNILTAMGGALRLLGKRLTHDQHATKIVDQGMISLEQGRNLVAQLLNVTRREGTIEELDINAVLSSMTTLLNSVASPKATVHLNLATDLHQCRIDRSRLGAAILNLVMNACDAMPRDREAAGLILITSANYKSQTRHIGQSGEASFVSVTVRDNGAGMLPEVRQRALEPLFTTKGTQGTGLGLAQVHTFVRDMGGTMEIESEEGKGTTVHLRFPLRIGSRAVREFQPSGPGISGAASSVLAPDERG